MVACTAYYLTGDVPPSRYSLGGIVLAVKWVSSVFFVRLPPPKQVSASEVGKSSFSSILCPKCLRCNGLRLFLDFAGHLGFTQNLATH